VPTIPVLVGAVIDPVCVQGPYGSYSLFNFDKCACSRDAASTHGSGLKVLQTRGPVAVSDVIF
jgi:hypothetical protein